MLTASEIVSALNGVNAAARFFGVRPPSVTDWVKNGEIPRERLVIMAARLEGKVNGFSRQTQFPTEYAEIWPELAKEAA